MRTEAQLALDSQSPAQAGIFFESEDFTKGLEQFTGPGNLHAFSEGFWIRHHDLINDGSALVIQAALGQNGKLFNPDLKTGGEDVITLLFDTHGRTNGQYGWQLSWAHIGKRLVLQIDANRSADLEANAFHYDEQGRLLGESSLNQPDTTRVSHSVQWLATHEMSKAKVRNMRERKQKAEQNLTQFSVDGLRRYSVNRYDEEIAKLQSRIDAVGFVAMRRFRR